ncbi:MAG: virulence factor family protein [Acidiferrobacterales bacterium]
MKQLPLMLAAIFCVPGLFGLAHAESLRFGRLGTVVIFRQSPHPRHVALLLSDAKGWTAADTAIAQTLASADGMILGVDLNYYLKKVAGPKCAYPAGDFEALSQYTQKKLGFPSYIRPVLAGSGLGAAVAYGTLAQAPVGTFRGALGFNFCPDAPLAQALCRGDGLRSQREPDAHGQLLLPSALTAPWSVLGAGTGSACNSARSFVEKIPSARFTPVDSAAAAPVPSDATLALVRQAFLDVAQPQARETGSARPVTDLPLVEVPATVTANNSLVVMVSGDGGWAGLDQELARALAGRGYSIVGLNSLKYFWSRRTPDEAGHDLTRILDYYLKAWNKEQVLLIGYSRGADVLPFMASRLPAALQSRVKLIALLGPGKNIDFEFHLSDWLPGSGGQSTALPTYPEVQKLQAMQLLCIYGREEKYSLCRQLTPKSGQVVELKGGHHFDGDYGNLATTILNALPSGALPSAPASVP